MFLIIPAWLAANATDLQSLSSTSPIMESETVNGKVSRTLVQHDQEVCIITILDCSHQTVFSLDYVEVCCQNPSLGWLWCQRAMLVLWGCESTVRSIYNLWAMHNLNNNSFSIGVFTTGSHTKYLKGFIWNVHTNAACPACLCNTGFLDTSLIRQATPTFEMVIGS